MCYRRYCFTLVLNNFTKKKKRKENREEKRENISENTKLKEEKKMGNKWKGLVRTLDLNSIVQCYETRIKPKKKRGKGKIRRKKEDSTAKNIIIKI